MPEPVVFNHVGHCVTDLDKSRRFYEELLGFVFEREFDAPDDPTSQLLRIEKPVGLRAVYLRRDGLLLELLHFDRPGNPPYRERAMNEPGLTHLSLSVDDLDGVLARIAEYGGAVLQETNIGFGVNVQDPDGQLIELLPMSYRDHLAAEQ